MANFQVYGYNSGIYNSMFFLRNNFCAFVLISLNDVIFTKGNDLSHIFGLTEYYPELDKVGIHILP